MISFAQMHHPALSGIPVARWSMYSKRNLVVAHAKKDHRVELVIKVNQIDPLTLNRWHLRYHLRGALGLRASVREDPSLDALRAPA